MGVCKALAEMMALAATLALGLTGTLAGQSLPPTHVDDFTGKPRVIVISDIGN